MGFAVVSITNEGWTPMAGVDVEAFDMDNPTSVVDKATTGTDGVARFSALAAGKKVFFKPRVTRNSGTYGDQSLYGKVRLQILASSGDNCADMVVDKDGWGTHETIQSAIDDAVAGGGTTRVNIFVRPGTYVESLSVPLTTVPIALYTCDGSGLVGSPVDVALGSSAVVTASVLVAPPTGQVALNYNDNEFVIISAPLELVGIKLKAVATYCVSTGRGDLRFKDCILESTGALITSHGVIGVGVDTLRIEESVLQGAASSYAIALRGSTCRIRNSWIFGVIRWEGTGGFSLIGSSVRGSTTSASGEAVVHVNAALVQVNRHIVQANFIQQDSDGRGVFVGGGAGSGEIVVVGNVIKRPTGTSGTAFVANNAGGAIGNGLVVGNYFLNWATGIQVVGAFELLGFPNHYKNVTSHFSGTGTLSQPEAAAHGLVVGVTSSGGGLIVGDGSGGWTTLPIGDSGNVLQSDGSTPQWAPVSNVAVTKAQMYVPFGSAAVSGQAHTP